MEDILIKLILLFIIYLVPQAMIINGIFLAAQGSTEILPDGTEKDSEMILYPIYKWLHQKRLESIEYTGGEANKIIKRISDQFPALQLNTEIEWYALQLIGDQRLMLLKHAELIKNVFGVKFMLFDHNYGVRFYKEYDVYRFSKYLRKPILGCVICMSSFWGIFTFLIPGLLLFHGDPIIAALYVPNTLALAYLNYKIMKPL